MEVPDLEIYSWSVPSTGKYLKDIIEDANIIQDRDIKFHDRTNYDLRVYQLRRLNQVYNRPCHKACKREICIAI
jgi:hypothetical protein